MRRSGAPAQENEFDNMIRHTFESRLRDTMTENRALRTALRDLKSRWDATLESHDGTTPEHAVKDGVFELPSELCVGTLTTELAHRIEALGYYHTQVESASGSLTMAQQLTEAKKVIPEQQKLLAEATLGTAV